MDWSWVQTFIVAAELGSQNAAARQLGLTQPTVGRHLDALEEHLGTSLFVRSNRGVELTDSGRALYEQTEDLVGRFDLLARTAHGLEEEPAGTVRLSINEPVAAQMLPGWYGEVRENYPGLQLEIAVENQAANLSRREADVAVRMFRPEQGQLIARFVGESPISLYAHQAYLERYGLPSWGADLSAHTIVGSDRDPTFHKLIAELGMKPSEFAFRTDSLHLQAEAVFSGVGIGALHQCVARERPELVRVLPELPLPTYPIWVVTHESLRRQQTVWTVFRSLFAYLSGYLPESRPTCP